MRRRVLSIRSVLRIGACVGALVAAVFAGGSAAQATPVFSEISQGFNSGKLPAGDFLWFNAVLQLSGTIPTAPFDVFVTGSTITSSDFSIVVPNSTIIFSSTATQATTTFGGHGWITTIPTSVDGKDAFLDGVGFQIPSGGLPGSIKPVTWSADFATNASSKLTLNWKWAAALYSSKFPTNNLSLGVKPTDDNNASAYKNSDHAGTPELAKPYFFGGAGTGGGGSNFTGSYSSTAQVTPGPPLAPVPEPSTWMLLGSPLGAMAAWRRFRFRRK